MKVSVLRHKYIVAIVVAVFIVVNAVIYYRERKSMTAENQNDTKDTILRDLIAKSRSAQNNHTKDTILRDLIAKSRSAQNDDTNDTILRDLIAKSRSAQKSLKSSCYSYHEFRQLDFLHPVLKNKLCRNAGAYIPNSDGYPMCVLPNPFDENMLNLVREGSDIADYPATDNSKMLMFVSKGNDVLSALHRGGQTWEPKRVRWLLKFTKKLSSVTFLDIGCNLGVYTIEAAKMGLTTVSLDANIRNLLRVRLSLNAANLDASLVWNYVSEDKDLKYLNFLGGDNCNLGYAGKFIVGIVDTVPIMPLRSEKLAGLIHSKIVVIKVDIEGGETSFFMASGRLFKDFTVAAVQMEWNAPFTSKDNGDKMIKFFTDMNYKGWFVPQMTPVDFKKIGPSDSVDVLWVHPNFIGMM